MIEVILKKELCLNYDIVNYSKGNIDIPPFGFSLKNTNEILFSLIHRTVSYEVSRLSNK